MNRTLYASFLALPLVLSSASVLSKTVTDDAGIPVNIVKPAQRIADAWYAHHGFVE